MLSPATTSSERGETEEHRLPGLLRLPRELRLQIYGYLLPDARTVPAYTYNSGYEARYTKHGLARSGLYTRGRFRLRQDGCLCETAIMRVSKLICSETTSFVYDRMTVEIEVSAAGIAFYPGEHIGQQTLVIANELGPFLHNIRNIHLILFAQPAPITSVQGDIDCPPRRFKDHVNIVAHHLRLDWLNRGKLSVSYCASTTSTSELLDVLTWHLRPIARLRDVERVEISRLTVKQYCNIESDSDHELNSKFLNLMESDIGPNFRESPEFIQRHNQRKRRREQTQKRIEDLLQDAKTEMSNRSIPTDNPPLVAVYSLFRAWMLASRMMDIGFTHPVPEMQIKRDRLAVWEAYDQGDCRKFSAALAAMRRHHQSLCERLDQTINELINGSLEVGLAEHPGVCRVQEQRQIQLDSSMAADFV